MDKRFIVACILLIAVVAFFPTSEANPRMRRQANANASAGANASVPISAAVQQVIDRLNSTLSDILLKPGLPDQITQTIQALLDKLTSNALITALQQLVDANPLLPTLPVQDLLKLLSKTLTGNLGKLVTVVQGLVGLLLSPLFLLLSVLGLPISMLTGLVGGLAGGLGGLGGAATIG